MSDLSFFFWGNGRTSRIGYWIIFGGLWGAAVLLGFALGLILVLGSLGGFSATSGAVAVLKTTLSWTLIWGLACNAFRRLHDLGRSGWWVLLAMPLSAFAGGLTVVIARNALHLSGTPQLWGQLGGGLVWVGLIVGVGSLKGENEDNRFGATYAEAGL